MFRTPIPNADISRLERLSPDELIDIFSFFLTSGPRAVDYTLLAGAWDTYFSRQFLTADELIGEMQGGNPPLPPAHEHVLREFISEDCRRGGQFVLEIIRAGSMISRSALFMMADPRNLATIPAGGTTAIHLLAGACDRQVRPAFIRRIGRTLLSTVYDSWGLPVLYTLFGLGDLCRADLDAIAAVFSPEDLKKVMCRNRTGKDAFTVFSEISRSLQVHAPLDRHQFFQNPCGSRKEQQIKK